MIHIKQYCYIIQTAVALYLSVSGNRCSYTYSFGVFAVPSRL